MGRPQRKWSKVSNNTFVDCRSCILTGWLFLLQSLKWQCKQQRDNFNSMCIVNSTMVPYRLSSRLIRLTLGWHTGKWCTCNWTLKNGSAPTTQIANNTFKQVTLCHTIEVYDSAIPHPHIYTRPPVDQECWKTSNLDTVSGFSMTLTKTLTSHLEKLFNSVFPITW